MKQEFVKIYNDCIKREGAKELLEYLLKSDFFVTPASAKFHCAYQGGLAEHSVNVYKRLVKILVSQYGDEWEKVFPHESVAICGLLHDVCKVDYYFEEKRNTKVNGEWVEKPYYSIKEILPYGHGEKSVYIINGFMRLTRSEAMAINWHMGGFDDRVRGGSYSMSAAFEKEPLCVLLHTADLISTYLDENRNK